jgi:O-antigen/teichoic acid export membrane protein
MLKRIVEKIRNQITNNNIIKNAFSIFYLQTIASIISFVNTYLLLRAIGVSGIGTIAILTTYVNFYIAIFSFQSYSAIIKFGQDALATNDMLKLKQYFKRAFILDLISSLVTLIIAYLCIELTSKYFEIDNKTHQYIILYLVLIPFSIFRSISAILRLNNDYKTEPLVAIMSAVLKTIIVVFGVYKNYTIEYFIFADVFLSIIGSILLLIFGYRCLKHMHCLDFIKIKLTPDKQFTRFNIYNNLVSTLDLPTGQLTNFIVNKLLGVDAVGIFNIVAKFGSIFNQVISAITQSLFPELSRLVATKQLETAFAVVKKTFLIMIVSGAVGSIAFILTYQIWLDKFIPATFYNGSLISIYTLYICYF